MGEYILLALSVTAALGCGVVGGIFFAFSNFVMRALARRPTIEAIGAMQAINITVLNPGFLGVFLGTGVVCIGTLVLSLLSWRNPTSALIVAGSMLYVVGTVGVTVFANVPRNDILAPLDPDSSQSAEVWENYVRGWTRWNHVRTVAALGASVAFTLSLAL
jgi:uncharacterized membrane protein